MSVATASAGYAMSMSVSVGIINDSVNAEIKELDITRNSSAAASGRQVVVQSYQETDIAIGGGSLAAGNSAGMLPSPMLKSAIPRRVVRRRRRPLRHGNFADAKNVTVAAGNTSRIVAGAARGR